MVDFNKRFLITAALPYANGELHIGGLRSTYLPADVFSRYCKLRGYETLFVCATDEHGAPIEINAARAGVPPEEFVKKFRPKHRKDFFDAGVVFDSFYYTHSDEDRELSQQFFEALKAGGHIFKKKVMQTYCPKCNRVLPDRYVKGVCPNCGTHDQYGDYCEKCGKTYTTDDLVTPYCAICNGVPEKQEVEHFFFKLSAFKPFFEKWFSENKDLQQDVVHYLRNWLADLQDWDITRDGPYFGIPIPGAKDQYFYVWFDAPIGYIASTKAWCDSNGSDVKQWWNEDTEIVHFIGKDIVYHHYLFWPAMLKGAKWALPKRIPARGYLNVEGEKMSKSRGTFILLSDFTRKFRPDYLRYYLTAVTPNNSSDGNFSWHEFGQRVNKELIDSYGNLVNRVLTFIYNKYDAVIPITNDFTEEDKAFEKEISVMLDETAKSYEAIELKDALEKALAFSGRANKYFNDGAPWKKKEHAPTVLLLSARAVYALSVALNPIIPFSTQNVFACFGTEPKWGGSIAAGSKINKPELLFAKIEDGQLKL